MEVVRCPRCGRVSFYIKGNYQGYWTGACQWDGCRYKGKKDSSYKEYPKHIEERMREALRA